MVIFDPFLDQNHAGIGIEPIPDPCLILAKSAKFWLKSTKTRITEQNAQERCFADFREKPLKNNTYKN